MDNFDLSTHEPYSIEPESDVQQAASQQKKAGMGKTAVTIIRVAVILIIGVTILAAVNSTTASMTAGGVTIHLTENPLDSDTITLEDAILYYLLLLSLQNIITFATFIKHKYNPVYILP